jgi:hypothetical protein
MLPLATDWATVSSLLTGIGTLALAIATFASVRSANRSARIAEAALQEQRRPVLSPSRLDDPLQKMMFLGGHWIRADGGRGVAEHVDGVVYLGLSLRNVGSGMAVCHGWAIRTGVVSSREMPAHAEVEEFRLQTRDLYVASGDVGMWQGALRDPGDPVRAAVADAIEARDPLTIELLYTDQIGQQRTITRFALSAAGDTWLASVNRHWYLDWDGPRAESEVIQAVELITRERDAVEQRAAALREHPDEEDGEVTAEAPAPGATDTADEPGSRPLARSRDGR